MANNNEVPGVSGENPETVRLLPTSRNTQRNGAMYDTDGVAPDDSTEEEAVANLNSLEHVIDEFDRLTSIQHPSESVRQKSRDLVQKMREMMESLDETHNEVGALEDPTETEHLNNFRTILNLPEEVERLRLRRRSEELLQERKNIIKKLRYMAKLMETNLNDSLQKERIGTGMGIGGGLVAAAGLAAAPFTGGISVVLTTTGLFGSMLGVTASLGAQFSAYTMDREILNSLEQDLKEHIAHIEELSSLESTYLTHAFRMRPTLEALGRLSVENLMQLFTALRISTMGEMTDSAIMNQTLDTDPEIKRFIETLPLNMSSEFQQELAATCTSIRNGILRIKEAIKDFCKYYDYSKIFKSTATITALTGEAVLTALSSCAKAYATKIVRNAAGTLTAAFIILDVFHMTQIWNATGDTPTVQQLRKMADDLEAEIQDLS